MTETETTGFWFFEPNLEPTLLLLSHVVKYGFDNSDLDAVKYGLTSTSARKDKWWTYQLIGEKTIDLRLALDEENTDIIFIELSFDKTLLAEIELCEFTVQFFFMQYRHTARD